MQLLDGRKLADKVREDIRNDIQKLAPLKTGSLTGSGKLTPGLAVLLVGNDPASHLYVSLKEKAAQAVGIHFEKFLFFATTSEGEIARKIAELNARTDIHGVIIQVPLPDHLSEDRLIAAIDPKKDVDGFHAKNIEALLAGRPTIIPSVARGIIALIEATHVTLAGKHATILANSDVFARPLRYLLHARGLKAAATRPDAADALEKILLADVLVTAIGRPHFVTAQMIKKDAIVIDVGTTRTDDGMILGDAHPNISEKAAWLTPVPGGVGPMTVAYLLRNVVDAATVLQKH